jgi:hypothetical protein
MDIYVRTGSSSLEDYAMVDGNKCENCRRIVPAPKACRKQTKYCDECALQKKRAGAQNSWPADVKAEYMRKYMRGYRKSHPRLSTEYVREHRKRLRESSGTASYLSSVAIVLAFLLVSFSENLDLSFETLPALLSYLELLAIKVTGFIVVVFICWKHLKQFWKKK